MRHTAPKRTPFECAVQSLRSILEFLRYDLVMPPETIQLQVNAILQSFVVRELYEQSRGPNEIKPK